MYIKNQRRKNLIKGFEIESSKGEYIPDFLERKFGDYTPDIQEKVEKYCKHNCSRSKRNRLERELEPFFETNETKKEIFENMKQGNFRYNEEAEINPYITLLTMLIAGGLVGGASIGILISQEMKKSQQNNSPPQIIINNGNTTAPNHNPVLETGEAPDIIYEDALVKGWEHKTNISDIDNDNLTVKIDPEAGRYFNMDNNGVLKLDKEKAYDSIKKVWRIEPGVQKVKINVSDDKGGYTEGDLSVKMDHKQAPMEIIKPLAVSGYSEGTDKGVLIEFQAKDNANEISKAHFDIYKDLSKKPIKSWDIDNKASDKRGLAVKEKVEIPNSTEGGQYFVVGKVYDNGTYFNKVLEQVTLNGTPFNLKDFETYLDGKIELTPSPDKLLIKFKLADIDSKTADGEYKINILKEGNILESRNIANPLLKAYNQVEISTTNTSLYAPEDNILIELVKILNGKEQLLDRTNTTIGNSAPVLSSASVSFEVDNYNNVKLVKYGYMNITDDRGIDKFTVDLRTSNGLNYHLRTIEGEGQKTLETEEVNGRPIDISACPGNSTVTFTAYDINGASAAVVAEGQVPDIIEKITEFEVKQNSTDRNVFDIFLNVSNPDEFVSDPGFSLNVFYGTEKWSEVSGNISLINNGKGRFSYNAQINASARPAGVHNFIVGNSNVQDADSAAPLNDHPKATVLESYYNPILKKFFRTLEINDTDSETTNASGKITFDDSEKTWNYNIQNITKDKKILTAEIDFSNVPTKTLLKLNETIKDEFQDENSNLNDIQTDGNYKIKSVQGNGEPSFVYDKGNNTGIFTKMSQDKFDNESLDDCEKLLSQNAIDYMKNHPELINESDPVETMDNVYPVIKNFKKENQYVEFTSFMKKLKHDILYNDTISEENKTKWERFEINLVKFGSTESYLPVAAYDKNKDDIIESTNDKATTELHTFSASQRIDYEYRKDHGSTPIIEFDKYLGEFGFDTTKEAVKNLLVDVMDLEVHSNQPTNWSTLRNTFDFNNDESGISAMKEICKLVKYPESYNNTEEGNQKNIDVLKNITNTLASRYKSQPNDLDDTKIIIEFEADKFAMAGVQESRRRN